MADDVFDLFSDGSYTPTMTPMPWRAGVRIDLDDYGRILLHHMPSGRKNAIEASKLAEHLGLPWEKTEYPLRNLIRRLILERGWPLGTVIMGRSKGYYLIDSDTDAGLYSGHLENRANAILERKDSVLDGWERRKRSKDAGRDWPKVN